MKYHVCNACSTNLRTRLYVNIYRLKARQLTKRIISPYKPNLDSMLRSVLPASRFTLCVSQPPETDIPATLLTIGHIWSKHKSLVWVYTCAGAQNEWILTRPAIFETIYSTARIFADTNRSKSLMILCIILFPMISPITTDRFRSATGTRTTR